MQKRTSSCASLLALVLLVVGPISAWAAQATLVADAHVNSALPAVNSGAISNLNVGAGYTALMQFDLGMLPSGTTATQISRAVLLLYCNRVDVTGTVSLQAVNAAWGEYSVTYATLPALASAAQNFTVGQAGAYVPVDVTALVQAWVATPSSNHGLALSASAASMQFDSKENDQTAHAPMLDVTLASAGPVGPQGPQGLTGAPGAQGAAGPAGTQGVKGDTGAAGAPGAMGAPGLTGPTGASGPTGPQGATGPQGPVGPQGVAGVQGPVGPVGISFQGAYSAAIKYGLGDGVLYGGAGYVSLIANNQGHAPDLSPTQWSEFASGGAGPAGPAGPTGPVGSAGPMGPAGAAGAAGPVGLTGPAGPAGAIGISYRGVYAEATSYAVNDAVSYQGSSYISLVAGNQGHTPDVNPASWGVLAAQGAAGAVGARFRGAWGSGVPYAVSDAVSFGGSTYLALAANAAEEPDLFPATWAVMAAQGAVGPMGPSGPSGVSATVSIGSVTTGLAGSQARVTNSGTSSAAVLNFVIPQGAAGTNGTGGGSAASSALPVSVYHAVSFSFTFYSLSGAASSATETAPVLTWMPNACTATTLSVYSQQANPIVVKLRQGTPTTMSDTGLTCSVVAEGTCSVTGSVPIAAGSFVDLSVTGADGTPSAVWTALGCS